MYTKPYKISKALVKEAWEEVKANRGSHGVDGETITKYESKLERNLYKLWNRMSSGSYFPQAIRRVSIPKKTGGERILGIPTVNDRVAQTVISKILENNLDKYFHEDSYGYRPNKSALDAIQVTRGRCWKMDWVVEYDIKGLFDNIDHELLMRAVRKHIKVLWMILYIERMIKAPMQDEKSQLEDRKRGVPQGGVISPILSNLFMHYVLDLWLTTNYPNIRWCRYSDDGILHCRTEREANHMLKVIAKRFEECGLKMHPKKSKIVYCKDEIRKKDYPNTEFEFLGYSFRSRRARNHKQGRNFAGFNPAISKSSRESIHAEIRDWKIIRKTSSDLQDIADSINPVLRGWLQYYGKYYVTELYPIFRHINKLLAKWLMRKSIKFAKHKIRAYKAIAKLAEAKPDMFTHWSIGIKSVVA